jgi:hypothetical protein
MPLKFTPEHAIYDAGCQIVRFLARDESRLVPCAVIGRALAAAALAHSLEKSEPPPRLSDVQGRNSGGGAREVSEAPHGGRWPRHSAQKGPGRRLTALEGRSCKSRLNDVAFQRILRRRPKARFGVSSINVSTLQRPALAYIAAMAVFGTGEQLEVSSNWATLWHADDWIG